MLANRSSFLKRAWKAVLAAWKVVLAVFGALALFGGGVTQWDTIRSAFFSTKAAAEAHIEEPEVEAMTRQAYESGPAQRAAPTAAVTDGAAPRPAGFRTSFAVYAVPAAAQPVAGRLVVVSFEEEAKDVETKIKAEGEKVKEEAKRDEEDAAREKARAAEEQKSAEVREQEEEQKGQEDQKRAEEAQKQDAAQAKAEQAKAEEAEKAAEKAHETVRAKKQEVARPLTQQRIESGASADQVEEVLRKAGDSERCHRTCGLKPFVEKALKEKSGNATAAAEVVRPVAASNTGAFLHFRVILKGLEHKVVFVSYVLVQNNGQLPPEAYQGQVTIKTVAPSREPESRWVDCWVPLPSSSQEYHLELTVSDSQEDLDIRKTTSFD
jgi:hypothetical protein